MTTTFRVAADELDQTILNRIKEMFRKKRIAIVVYEEEEVPEPGLVAQRPSNGALDYYMTHPVKFEGFPPFDREDIYRGRAGA